ncbi:hypothetical protein C8N31_12022 [Sulfitobacter mediterraneus]|uniref:Uncharacterized protein n=2 Tax=Sulfitobacter mediterraneus TaxID=83219 RepID=A0A2T6C0Q7_9RHOB|nr:hypothetical protein C8N31_12022 [Sulfitobacter mediterraneus]
MTSTGATSSPDKQTIEIARLKNGRITYVILLQHGYSFVVYAETSDGFSWGHTEKAIHRLYNRTTSIRIVRKVWKIVKTYIYTNRLSFFEISAGDESRAKLYERFLSGLNRYRVIRTGNSFYVMRCQAG